MGLFDRLKGLTAPPSTQLPDDDEVPPWLREAIPPAFGPPGHAGQPGAAPGAGSPDPYRRAPARGAGSHPAAAPPVAEPPAYSPPPAPTTQSPPPPAWPAASPPAAPTPAQPSSAQRPWYGKPPDQDGGPVPWFARQQAAPAAPPAPAPPAYTPPVATPPPAYTPPPPAQTPPPSPPAQPRVSQVVNTLTDVVLENWRDYPLDAETLSLLQVGLPYLTQRDCSRDAIVAGQTSARLGYVARAAEYAELPSARESNDELFEELSESLEAADRSGGSIVNAMAEFAADLAISEPVDPPASDGGPSWAVPGVDGSVRGRVRDTLLTGIRCPEDITRQDLQHMWKYGYFLRCMEEFFFDEE